MGTKTQLNFTHSGISTSGDYTFIVDYVIYGYIHNGGNGELVYLYMGY